MNRKINLNIDVYGCICMYMGIHMYGKEREIEREIERVKERERKREREIERVKERQRGERERALLLQSAQ